MMLGVRSLAHSRLIRWGMYGNAPRFVPRLRHAAQRQHAALRDAARDRRRRARRSSTSRCCAIRAAASAARVLRGRRRPDVRALLAPLEPARRDPEPSEAWWARILRDGATPERRVGRQAHVEPRSRHARPGAGARRRPGGAGARRGLERAARRRAGARARHAARQGRPGRVAVDRGADAGLARRRRHAGGAASGTASRASSTS